MNILVPESWENHNEMQTNCLNTFIQKIMENFLQPKETDEEYWILKEILWDNFEKYKKYWTIKSIRIARELRKIGMRIEPTDRKYMKYRTPEKIERLNKRINIDKYWRKITIRKPYWQWEEEREITAKTHYIFRV